MRNKGFNQRENNRDLKSAAFLNSLDEKTVHHFSSIAKYELIKAKARVAAASCPKENGYVYIPNSFMDELLKSDLSVEQFNDVLRIFDPRRVIK